MLHSTPHRVQECLINVPAQQHALEQELLFIRLYGSSALSFVLRYRHIKGFNFKLFGRVDEDVG